MIFFPFFSVFIVSLLVWCCCEMRPYEHYETPRQYKVEFISFTVMSVSFVGTLLSSVVQSAYGNG